MLSIGTQQPLRTLPAPDRKPDAAPDLVYGSKFAPLLSYHPGMFRVVSAALAAELRANRKENS